MFCVECGREGPTYGGLCSTCFGERHTLLRPPERVDIPQCVHCSRFLIGKGWAEVPLEEACRAALLEKSRLDKEVRKVSLAPTFRHEDERNLLVAVKASLAVEDFLVTRRFETKVRIQGATCPACGRRRGMYYEAILQFRASTGRLPEDLAAEASRYVEDAVAADPNQFITKVETVRGGLDFYLSSNAQAKTIAKAYRDWGAETRASPKVYGQKEGKELYRVTYLVRFLTPGKRATGGRAHSKRGR